MGCKTLRRSQLNGNEDLLVLGGGIAGLAAGYYAHKAGLPFTILEARDVVGGNCLTIAHQGFRFDSGAHRFHDKDAAQTRQVRDLLGEEIGRVSNPSKIYHRGTFIDFPLSLSDLVRNLGMPFVFKAGLEVLSARIQPRRTDSNFEEFAVRAYGRTIADFFLLGYSEKLWGVPPRFLSPVVSGGRLRGLNLATFLFERLIRNGTNHLDGSFYYPRHGIQSIPEGLASACGRDRIRTGARVTRIRHDGRCIRAVEVNGRETWEVKRAVSTLPLTELLQMLDPPPPPEVGRAAAKLRFRDVVLCAFFLDRPSVSDCASFYFSDRRFPFSRVYEPRNRSAAMAPPGQTALVAEFPCQKDDAIGRASDAEIRDMTRSTLVRIGLVRPEEILDSLVVRIGFAYPVIVCETRDVTRLIFDFLGRLENLSLSGRGACFEYIHMHDLMRRGQELVARLARG